MTTETLNSTKEMLSALNDLRISTVRDKEPKAVGRVYAMTEDGKTAHGVTGGSSAAEAKAKAHEMLPDSAEILKIVEFTEGQIEHPLRN